MSGHRMLIVPGRCFRRVFPELAYMLVFAECNRFTGAGLGATDDSITCY
jgi:hypothetical protein